MSTRNQSVILTPTEKRQAVAEAKEAVRVAKIALAEVLNERKALDRDYNAAIKINDKRTLATKGELTRAENQLLRVNPAAAPKAVPSPTS